MASSGAEFLLELYGEEIPAGFQPHAARELEKLLSTALKEQGLEPESLTTYTTPQRLVAHVTGLPDKTPQIEEERRGPRADAPDKAIEGFLGSTGLTLDQCEKRQTEKGEFYFAMIKKGGESTAELLREIIDHTLRTFSWPKSMRHGYHIFDWVRPLHRVLAVFEGKPLKNGIRLYSLSAPKDKKARNIPLGNTTSGHRFLAPKDFTVSSFDDYAKKLEKAKVMLDPAARKQSILDQAEQLLKPKKLRLKEDSGLLEEVTGLVEWPVVLLGNIDEDFMSLPPEVLTSALRTHQKYFNVETSDGELAPYFIVVSNMETKDKGKTITAGNERVLRARLSDARFFYDQDLKIPLQDNVPKLASIVFHQKIGTVAERVERINNLAKSLASHVEGANAISCAMAAILCKADLVSHMVGEFPELQGIMGATYAKEQGEQDDIVQAIAEHYAPRGPSDTCPTAPTSVVVALAEKLDTLISLFTVGERPTGSKDPYALRRAALGVIRLILENNLRINLRQYLIDPVADDLMDFFADRLKVYLKEHGVRHDCIAAVFTQKGEDDLVYLVEKAKALQAFLESEDGQNLLTAYKRAANILRAESKKESKKGGTEYDGAINPSKLEQDEEKKLFEALTTSRDQFAGHLANEDFAAAMTEMAKLRTDIDLFFDKVTVNADDPGLRTNRLNLLAQIQLTMSDLADFSQIEG